MPRRRSPGPGPTPTDEQTEKFARLVAARQARPTAASAAERKRKQRANEKRRQNTYRAMQLAKSRAEKEGAHEPELTRERARQFVRLLAAGIGASTALQYFGATYAQSLDEHELSLWVRKWANSQLVLDALTEFNGGSWEDLSVERRIQLATDKHLSELAHMLFTSQYRAAEGSMLKKLDAARDALLTFLSAGEGEASDPVRKFVEELLAGRVEGEGANGVPLSISLPLKMPKQ